MDVILKSSIVVEKFGINLQATCDHRRRFLNISMKYPGATSDFVAFDTSMFHGEICTPGFLAPGLCLFGDNAYVNQTYMATPYPNISDNCFKDDYNFYHSQLRISIECAFGMLVSRWGILQKPLSSNYTIRKIVYLVNCLCRLHNYLIDACSGEETVPDHTSHDLLQIHMDGGVQKMEHTIKNISESNSDVDYHFIAWRKTF